MDGPDPLVIAALLLRRRQVRIREIAERADVDAAQRLNRAGGRADDEIGVSRARRIDRTSARRAP